MSDEIKVANLLYSYCEIMDSGKFEDVARLFEHAKVKVGEAAGVSGATEEGDDRQTHEGGENSEGTHGIGSRGGVD